MAVKRSSSKKASNRKASPQPAGPQRKSVSIERINNGFIVSQYNDRTFKETKNYAKNLKEAKNTASKMLG